ncbi:MAG: OadG family protein [gamma proteobacterium symbiont of Taylorina sp.]|nr:OadG family protein [gamma proteobacterium symbiont of Taylorina sp.]
MQLGLELILMGMGTVFSFLVILVFCINIMSKVVSLLEPDSIETDQNNIPDETLIAVISAAIHQHRHKKL